LIENPYNQTTDNQNQQNTHHLKKELDIDGNSPPEKQKSHHKSNKDSSNCAQNSTRSAFGLS